ncbi:MAG: hypothetical protein LWW86_04880 [Micrococcales bacterium]|nr:hypothetical protein [Micrococcales bacterium]
MGNFADWISALAGAGALAAAVWAGVTAKRLYDIERERDDRAVERLRRESASLVSAWIGVHSEQPDVPEDRQQRKFGVVVANRGTTPIHDIRVSSRNQDNRAQKPIEHRILPPGVYFIAESKDPQAKFPWKFPEQVSTLAGRVRPVTAARNWAVTDLTFRDSNGVQWRRDLQGNLTEVVDQPEQPPST